MTEERRTASTPPLIDLPTLGMGALMIVAFPLLFWLHSTGRIPAGVAVVLGTLAMNWSFTAWHEPAHHNFSRLTWVNHVFGILTSFASVYPGYFARRREHLAHHKWEGDPRIDPVYPRVQASFAAFPFRLLSRASRSSMAQVPRSFLPIAPWQRTFDRLSNLTAGGIVLWALLKGQWLPLAYVWILPRLAVYLLHAYVICFFPHSQPGGGFRLYRIRDHLGLSWITCFQNFHGVHHLWPSIPWHRYRSAAQAQKDELIRRGCEFP